MCCIPRAPGVEGWSPHVSNCHPRCHCCARLPSLWRPHPCPPLASRWKSTAPLLPNASASKRLLGHLQHHCKYTFFYFWHLRAAILLLAGNSKKAIKWLHAAWPVQSKSLEAPASRTELKRWEVSSPILARTLCVLQRGQYKHMRC